MAARIQSMTQGKPAKLILTFALSTVSGVVGFIMRTAARLGADAVLVASYFIGPEISSRAGTIP